MEIDFNEIVHELYEDLRVVKMKLPTKSKYFELVWNDTNKKNKKGKRHNLFDRLTRVDLSRKQIIEKIVKSVDKLKDSFVNINNPYIIELTESEFYLVVIKLSKNKLMINTILSKEMHPYKDDTILTIDEAEDLFDIDLSKFYADKLQSGSYGNMFIEIDIDESQLDVQPFYIKVEE